MTSLWRSVVGKLWMTIIGLVTVVLCILTFLLVQFFDNYYHEQQEGELLHLAHQVSRVFQTHPEILAFHISSELVEFSRTGLTVVANSTGKSWHFPAGADSPYIGEEVLMQDENLHHVFLGETVVVRDHFPVGEPNGTTPDLDVLMVSVPIISEGEVTGAVFLYQTLDIINETTDATKWIILYSAAVGILLTTIFAFFLSSRITSPLRQMKTAAGNMAKGDFHSRVDIRSRDEIGELAFTFNHMAQDLNDSIHELSHEKEHLTSILGSMVDGIVTVDIDGQIMLLNPPAEKILNSWYAEQPHPVDCFKLPDLLADIFADVVMDEKEHVQTIEAQGRFWTIIMSPLYNQEKIRGAVTVVRDMTEEKRLDILRKDFVANVSHELRTPISMLQGYSEALVDDVAVSKEMRQELAQIIHEESLRMGRLVSDLLDLARMEAGHVELERSHLNLHSFSERIINKFSNLAREEQIDLIEDIQPLHNQYELDADRIEQILTNLIDNAIRHTPEQGQVTVSLSENEHGALLCIQDTGAGIPENDLPFIFERFYKADKARTRGKAGTGIGLSIVKHLVEAHQGQIEVESNEGQGTIFYVFLPHAIQPEKGE